VRGGQLGAALRERPLNDRPEIIDRVDLQSGQPGDSRVDVTRRRQVEQHERFRLVATATADCDLELRTVKDRVRRAGRADDDVGPG
jgi:hypothetical protein